MPLVGYFVTREIWDLPKSTRTPNLKLLASPVSNLGKGFKIKKFDPGP